MGRTGASQRLTSALASSRRSAASESPAASGLKDTVSMRWMIEASDPSWLARRESSRNADRTSGAASRAGRIFASSIARSAARRAERS